MVSLSRLPFLFLVVPIAEITVFLLVGRQIGVLATVLLVVATAIAGSTLLRIQGLGTLSRIRQAMAEGRTPGKDLVHGAMIVLAGFLLLTPGFITDTLGLILFIPAVRERVFAFIRARVTIVPVSPAREHAIDLDSQDWRRD
ncbi:MAG: FxsA family protein [Rhizobiaceae bacterium]